MSDPNLSAQQPDLKIIFLGSAYVGKTSIMRQYTVGVFNELEDKPTVGATFFIKKWAGKSFVIWDTAGQEKFDSLNKFYCRKAAAAILVYDISSHESFETLRKYLNMVKENSENENSFIVVVGSKYDLIVDDPSKREVSLEEAREYATSINAKHIETSAKTNHNISRIFDLIGKHYYPTLDPTAAPTSSPNVATTASPGRAVSNGQISVLVRPDRPRQPSPEEGCAC